MNELKALINAEWGRGHPERRTKDFTKWTKGEWGAFIADRIADDADYFKTQSKYPKLDIRCIEIEVADVLEHINNLPLWQWKHTNGALLLGKFSDVIQENYFNNYVEERQRSGAGGWLGRSYELAAVAAEQSTSTIGKRAQAFRAIFDKTWHGRNRAKAAHEALLKDPDSELLQAEAAAQENCTLCNPGPAGKTLATGHLSQQSSDGELLHERRDVVVRRDEALEPCLERGVVPGDLDGLRRGAR